MNTDKTGQSNSYQEFGDIDIKTMVAQTLGPMGTRNAQVTFAVGMASSPPKNARMIVVEINSALYAVGGYCPKVQEELGLEDGETAIFSTDADGDLKAVTKYKADGSVETSNDNGSFSLNAAGDMICNGGAEPAIKAESLNTWLTTSFSVSTAFGPSGPALVPIPENCKNTKVLV